MRLALVLLIAACGTVGPKYTGTVRVADNRLVAINPDVKVVADADQPVFFARGSYWLFHDGTWFQSASATGGWVHAKTPPVPVKQIDQPFAYVHFKHDQPGKEIETVARAPEATHSNEDPARQPAEPSQRPAKDRQPSSIDPSVDPTLNMFQK